ncbi:MAG: hypothetical protein AAB521_01155 [Patescibacteria group bacterium]
MKKLIFLSLLFIGVLVISFRFASHTYAATVCPAPTISLDSVKMCTEVTSTNIKFNWNAISSSAYYKAEVCPGLTTSFGSSSCKTYANLIVPFAKPSTNELSPDTWYVYRVRTMQSTASPTCNTANKDDSSGWSNWSTSGACKTAASSTSTGGTCWNPTTGTGSINGAAKGATVDVSSGAKFTLTCNYGLANVSCIYPSVQGCTYVGWNGTTVSFSCTAPTAPGSYPVLCTIGSSSSCTAPGYTGGSCSDAGDNFLAGTLNIAGSTPPSSPPSASITGPTTGKVGQTLTYTGTANVSSGNLISGDLYWSPTSTESWTGFANGTGVPLSGSSQSFSKTWTPTDPGTYYVVVNAVSTGGQCTGNTFSITPPWVDCGPNDHLTVTISASNPTDPPTNLKATCSSTNTSVNLTWDPVLGSVGYDVSLRGGGINTGVGTTATSQTRSVSIGTTYTWGVNSCGNTACGTQAAGPSFTCGTLPKPAAPVMAAGQICSGSIAQANITWNPVSYATGYKIYRWNTPTANQWAVIATITNPLAKSYLLTPLTQNSGYTLRMIASNSAGDSGLSNQVDFLANRCTGPAPTIPPGNAADVNRDGIIDLIDFNLWLRAVLGKDLGPPYTANGMPFYPDANNSQSLDLLDFNIWLTAYTK